MTKTVEILVFDECPEPFLEHKPAPRWTNRWLCTVAGEYVCTACGADTGYLAEGEETTNHCVAYDTEEEARQDASNAECCVGGACHCRDFRYLGPIKVSSQ
jgi:hypothetical protein